MSGDAHVRFCERPGVRLPGATHLAFSFDDPKLIPVVIAKAKEIVGRCGFRVNPAKVRVQWAGAGRRVICGVAVDDQGIHPTREAKRRLRAARHQGNKGSARGLEEWCKLKSPKPRESKPVRTLSEKEAAAFERLRRYWRLPAVNFAAAVARKAVAERDLSGECFITNDPAYFMGMSNFTNGWTSCMRQPDGEYGEGVMAWLALAGASLAVFLGEEKKTFAGVTRRVMRARCLVYQMNDGTFAYDRVYAKNPADAEFLKKKLRAAGFVPVGNLPSGLYVAGSIPLGLPRPYLDSLRWVKVRVANGQRVRFRT